MAANTGLPLHRPAVHSHSSQLQFITAVFMDPSEIILFHLFFTLPVGLIELSEMVRSLPKDLFPSTLL